MINEYEGIWKEADVASVSVISRHLPGGIYENHKNLNQDSRSSDRDLNSVPPEYVA
jgi:hypothetical protein